MKIKQIFTASLLLSNKTLNKGTWRMHPFHKSVIYKATLEEMQLISSPKLSFKRTNMAVKSNGRRVWEFANSGTICGHNQWMEAICRILWDRSHISRPILWWVNIKMWSRIHALSTQEYIHLHPPDWVSNSPETSNNPEMANKPFYLAIPCFNTLVRYWF